MKILAIDSTSTVSTVAVCDEENLLAQFTVNNGNTHSETLLPMIEASLKVLKLTPNDIDLYACSAGPGSFTGVRIGVATIKGLAFDKCKPCAPISSLDALAHNLIYADGIICPVMNARRMQLYNALFLCKNGKLTRLTDDRLISVYELEQELRNHSEHKIYLCGDGYGITKDAFAFSSFTVADTPLIHRYQSAYSVALCALELAERKQLTTDIELSPVYLRASQAERERLERLEAEKDKKD